MAILIIEDGDRDNAIQIATVLDEMKLKAFLVGADKKSLEEIEKFFKG